MRVTLKLATSLDGRIATRTGESKWITSAEARRKVHELRSQHDSVLAGIGTVLKDDPQLTVRLDEAGTFTQPHRIILDTWLRTPVSARIFDDKTARVFIVCSERAGDGECDALKSVGADIFPVPESEDGHVSVLHAVQALRDAGLERVFVEGGGQVAAAFLKAGLVDTLEWFRAPMIIGGDGFPALGGIGVSALSDSIRLHRIAVRSIGPDVWETYERKAI